MNKKEFPILEYDGVSNNVIEPSSFIKPIDIPEQVVLCFYSEVIEKLKKEKKLKEVYCFHSQLGKHPVYELEYNGKRVTIIHPGIGAPFAAAMMEETIALGGKKFISCGSGGVLDKDITVGHVLIPTSAIRDEGTSYHYIEPSREIQINNIAVQAIDKILTRHKCSYKHVKAWTTDSFYRETVDKVKKRKEEGCLIVEMECSAFCAVAEYRDVIFGQILYGGDDVSCKEWDGRKEFDRSFIREAIFWFAVEASLEL